MIKSIFKLICQSLSPKHQFYNIIKLTINFLNYNKSNVYLNNEKKERHKLGKKSDRE